MKLKLSQIVIDKGTQTRDEIDQKTVTEYAEVLMNKEVMPPLEVFSDGINYYLVDGFHRYFANKQVGNTEVEVNIHKGTLRDAQEFALGVNDKHGLKRTNADKRKAVSIALADLEWSLLTNREIGKICRVSHTFVNAIKEKLEADKPKKKEKSPTDFSQKNRPAETEIDTEFDEEDKVHELLVQQKELEQENTKLLDQLALKTMDATPEQKNKAAETIAELRAENERLERELESVKISRDSYMKQNAEMQKQINYYKRELKKVAA
jgi:vacuolar-type H+-ATPase subunit I/STV1